MTMVIAIKGERMTLLDLIDQCILQDYEENVKEKDEYGDAKRIREAEEELFSELENESIEKIKLLEIAIRNQMENIYTESQKYLLNYAFRLGMEMQKAFDQEDYE